MSLAAGFVLKCARLRAPGRHAASACRLRSQLSGGCRDVVDAPASWQQWRCHYRRRKGDSPAAATVEKATAPLWASAPLLTNMSPKLRVSLINYALPPSRLLSGLS